MAKKDTNKDSAAAPAVTAQPKPVVRYVEVKFSRWEFAKSLEVLVSVAVLCLSLYLIFFSPSDMYLSTPRGMVMLNMKKKRARLASRTAEKKGRETAMMYTDLAILGIVGVATTGFLHGCARRIFNAQWRLEKAQAESMREALYNPEALAVLQKEIAEDRAVWEAENAERVAKGRPRLRERRMVKAIATAERLTSFLVIVTVIATAVVAPLVQLQSPSEVRGLGAAIVVFILVGGTICPSFDPSLNLVLSYCVVCHVGSILWILTMGFLSIRATWD